MNLNLPTPLDVAKGAVDAVKRFLFAIAFLLIVVPLFHWGVFTVGILLAIFGHRVIGIAFVAIGLIALCVSKNLRI